MQSPHRLHRTELKFQCSRALAVLEDGGELLLYVGRSAPHVQASYADAFAEVLDGAERTRVSRISLECWEVAADQGRWIARNKLDLPSAERPGAAPSPRETAPDGRV